MNQFSQPRILIVDDDKVLCELLAEQFHDDKFITAYELSGPAALKKIKEEKFNLIILNQNMPVMNGDEVLVKIKEYDSSIPVIMLSAQADPAIIVKCIKLGAADYINKPYDYEDLLGSVIKHLK